MTSSSPPHQFRNRAEIIVAPRLITWRYEEGNQDRINRMRKRRKYYRGLFICDNLSCISLHIPSLAWLKGDIARLLFMTEKYSIIQSQYGILTVSWHRMWIKVPSPAHWLCWTWTMSCQPSILPMGIVILFSSRRLLVIQMIL